MPLPPTGTFIDNLEASVVFYRDNSLFELTLPSRNVVQVGTGKDLSYPHIAPVWSYDGKKLALVQPEFLFATVVSYDDGGLIASYPIPDQYKNTDISLSFSPKGDILVIGLQKGKSAADQAISFQPLAADRKSSQYDRCRSGGVWISPDTFIGVCLLGDTETVVGLQFSDGTAAMTPLARGNNATFQLLGVIDYQTVLLKKIVGGQETLGALKLDGSFGSVPAQYAKLFPTKEALADPISALKKKISEKTGIKDVDDVNVSLDNTWIVFHANEGLYAVPLNFSEKPFFLGAGSFGRIRP